MLDLSGKGNGVALSGVTHGKRMPKAMTTILFCDSAIFSLKIRNIDIPNMAASEMMLKAVTICQRTSCDPPLVFNHIRETR